jgi:hypothetical protein
MTLTRIFAISFLWLLLATHLWPEVSPDGSWNDNFPIQTPAGRNGVQPSISIVFNSNTGNGVVGVGANICGLQHITRATNLNPLPGNHSTFMPENQTWDVFTPQGNCGQGPCKWEVKGRDGWTYIYGDSEDSRNYGLVKVLFVMELSTTPLSWALTKANQFGSMVNPLR